MSLNQVYFAGINAVSMEEFELMLNYIMGHHLLIKARETFRESQIESL